MRKQPTLGKIWQSVWNRKGLPRRARAGHSPSEALESRILPAIVSFTAVDDGFARDANRDGAYEFLDTTSNTLLTRNTTGNVGQERSLIEFDLSTLSNSVIINSATLIINVTSRTTSGRSRPLMNFVGYNGNGVITNADATAAGVAIGQQTIQTTGTQAITLDADFVKSLGGGFMGLRIENPVLNGNYAVFRALEASGLDPRLELDIELAVEDQTFEIDEQRPNGTIVGNVNPDPGSNLVFTKLAGDPGNVFAIDSNTGIITVADSTGVLPGQYVLTLSAEDPGGLITTFDVTINVKNLFGVNHPPTVNPAELTVEEYALNGTLVGTVTGSDPDSADPLSFTITGGNTDNAFQIDSRTGRITVRNQNALSYRNQTSFVLEVTARDTREPRLTGSALITILLSPRTSVAAQPNRVDLTAIADGEAQDANNDGTFETIVTDADTIEIQRGSVGVTGRRGILEFDLSGINSTKVVKGAFLTIYVNANAGSPFPLNIFGYSGNGVVSGGDATLGTLIGSEVITVASGADLRAYTIELDRTLIQQLIGTANELGLVLRNDTNGNSITIDSIEGPIANGDSLLRQPALHLDLEDAAEDAIFLNTTNQQITAARANATGTAFTTFTAGALAQGITFQTLLSGDFNGDGRIDVAGRNQANGQWLVARASAQQFVTGAPWGAWTTVSTFTDALVGDFNGDGRDDLVGRTSAGQLLVSLSTGITFSNQVFANDWQGNLTDLRVGDFNGDGRDDLAGRNSTTGVIQVALSTGSSFVTQDWGLWSTATTWSNVGVGDFNGDGRDDLIGRSAIGQFWVARSTGAAFQNVLFASTPAGTTLSDIRVGDFNGDGLDDVVARNQSNALVLLRSTGTNFTLINGGALPALPTGVVWADVAVGDFNRDGKSDLIARRSIATTVSGVTTTTQQLWVSTGSTAGAFTTTLFGTFTGVGPFRLLGVGNF